ncbi:Rap1a/Tai family immunity protein [Pseudomonas prosekii]|uniref:Rap1a immunity protein domain-containing protein n=1 Tax=Pseudomonas prosekii TaxID=1148509 RepID=A0A2U2D8D5_9PSED|nr:Rap1a/Tai family immunity protein [Pseudomonas prosekii]PWE44806.1 hypothetical protein C9I49_12690 [Pseudomonas prosekii]
MKTGMAVSIALALVVASTAAGADGNLLLAQCHASLQMLETTPKSAPDFNAGSCFGTVGGVMDTMTTLYYDLPKAAKACFPESGIQDGQAVRIVTRYMSEHPASLHKSGAMLSIEAFKAAYPCK